MSSEPSWQRNPDGSYTRFNPDGSPNMTVKNNTRTEDAARTGKPWFTKNPDGSFTRTDPDGSTRIVKGTDPQRIAGIVKLVIIFAVFVLGIVVIVTIADAVSSHH
jgi:hypothetical protein